MSSLSQEGLLALTWTFTGVALALTAGRYVIRLRYVGSFSADDLVHALAAGFLVSYVSTQTANFSREYAVESWAAGQQTTPPSYSSLDTYFRFIFAVSVQATLVLYLVKLCFLVFYRMLFGISKRFMRAWWIVLVIWVIAFLAQLFSILWNCNTPGQLFVVDACLSETAVTQTEVFVKWWCALNVLSDVSIMILPLWMVRTLHIRFSQKVGLSALILLAVIDVIFDILRTVSTVQGGSVALDTLWDILEPTIAVMVSALPAYSLVLRPSKPATRATSHQPLKPGSDGRSAWTSRATYELDSNSNIDMVSSS